jgi:pilus assembly protein CpaB
VSTRSLIALVLALVCGGSAAVGVNTYVKSAAPAANPNLTSIIVAAADIPRGSMLTAEQVKTREVPKDQVHARAITKLDDALNRAVMTPLIKDETLLEDKLAPKGSKGSMAWVTKPGMRAFTIHTPSVASGVAGFVMPGDHIDVLLTMSGDEKDGTGGGSTITLLQNLEVMAVDQLVEAPAQNKVNTNTLRSVTLQVTPDEALQLELGQNRGTLHLSLRNPEDVKDAHTKPATLAALKLHQEPLKVAAETPPPAPPPVVEEPKAPPKPKPVYMYHTALQRVVEHLNDGTSARRVITQGSSQMGIPWQEEFRSAGEFR